MFVLQPNPTFHATVTFPTLRGEDAKIKMEFKHLGRKAFEEFVSRLQGGVKNMEDMDGDSVLNSVKEVVVGWSGVDQPFSGEAMDLLFDAHPQSINAIVDTFVNAVTQGKGAEKN